MDYADSLLEWRMIPIGDIFFFAKSTDDGQEEGSSPHQDNYFQKAEWGAFVACGVYLDKANSDNGSLIVYPGTHWLGDANVILCLIFNMVKVVKFLRQIQLVIIVKSLQDMKSIR